MLGKYHLDPELARGYQMIFSKQEGRVIECKQALMILLHLLNFFFRYDNMMIKINHKASILIEITVIKTHTQTLAAIPSSRLRTSANTSNALIQLVYPTRQSCISELLNQFFED